jgi:hypothetical protein
VSRRDELVLVTAGKLNLRVWDLDLANRKVPRLGQASLAVKPPASQQFAPY